MAFLLGHHDPTVTRTVYMREIADGRRRAMRRSRMVASICLSADDAFCSDADSSSRAS